MSDLISIIVPIYNVDTYLDKCIMSIRNQTYRNIQIILVDDGSTDISYDICRKHQKQDDRIVVIHKENAGLVSARKTGIQAAEGVFVGYVDGDDWIEPDMYECLYKDMIHYDVDIVETVPFYDIGDCSRRGSGKLHPGYYSQKELLPIMLCDEDFNECRLTPYTCTKLFKRNMLFEVQMQVNECICLGEDAAVTYPYLLKCKNIYISDYVGYHYIQRKDSMCIEKNKGDQQSNLALIKHLKTAFCQGKNIENLFVQLNQYAKLLMLLRQIDCFDTQNGDKILEPYGGLRHGSKVIIYGAGNLGKSIYEYLHDTKGIEVAAWLDQQYERYQILGYPVNDPREMIGLKGTYDCVIVAVYSKKIADSIREYLMSIGVRIEQIRWFADAFIKQNIIDTM